MSGIVGLWNLDGKPVEVALLAKMSAALAHRGPDGEGRWVDGPIGLACQLMRVTPEATFETQPLVHPSGAVLVFDGRLDNRVELLASLAPSAKTPPAAPDPALVLAAYEAFGDALPERLNGDFALAIFDPRRQRLLLARDAVGVRPLYYYRAGNLCLFASEIKALLAHPVVSTAPYLPALAELLEPGHGVADQGWTVFEGILAVPPAHAVLISPERCTTRQYFHFYPGQCIRFGSEGEYVEAFREHFERAVCRRLRSAYPVAVSVSGGLDSSGIFCLGETLRRRTPGPIAPLLGFSQTVEDGSALDETAYLAEIEHAYGVAITRFPLPPPDPLANWRAELWHGELPFLDHWWNARQDYLAAVHDRGARVLLTGEWGDEMLFNWGYLIDLVRRFAWGKVRSHLDEYARWQSDVPPGTFRRLLLLDLLKSHLPGALLRPLRTFRRRLASRLAGRDWYTEALHRRTWRPAPVTMLSWYDMQSAAQENKIAARFGLELAFPFLDRDLIHFCLYVPGEMLTLRGVPKGLFREAMRGILPEAIRLRRWKGDGTARVNESVIHVYPTLVATLRSPGLGAQMGLVRQDKVEDAITRLAGSIQGPTFTTARSLLALLALELWLRLFFGPTAPGQRGFEDLESCARAAAS